MRKDLSPTPVFTPQDTSCEVQDFCLFVCQNHCRWL